MKIKPTINKSAVAGTPTTKYPIVFLYDTEQCTFEAGAQYPVAAALPVLDEGADAPVTIYATPGSISTKETTSGEFDSKGLIQEVSFSFPGANDLFTKFKATSMNKNFIVVTAQPTETADEYRFDIYGYGSNPMQVSTEGEDTKERVNTVLTFTQAQACIHSSSNYVGALPTFTGSSSIEG